MSIPCRFCCGLGLPAFILTTVFLPVAFSQQPPPENTDGISHQSDGTLESPQPKAGNAHGVPTNKRVLGIIPNYRTYPTLREYEPIRQKQKFGIAAQDSFDSGTVVLAALFAGEGQLTNATPEFGQGVAGYGRYFATSYADLVIGNFMTEAIYPAVLHQDPRYFRKGNGSGRSRFGYAVGQIFWTHRDAGGFQFNFSEIGGNATAVAMSNAYYPGDHDARTALSKFGLQIGIDMLSNVLKEFWPDVEHRFVRRHDTTAP